MPSEKAEELVMSGQRFPLEIRVSREMLKNRSDIMAVRTDYHPREVVVSLVTTEPQDLSRLQGILDNLPKPREATVARHSYLSDRSGAVRIGRLIVVDQVTEEVVELRLYPVREMAEDSPSVVSNNDWEKYLRRAGL